MDRGAGMAMTQAYKSVQERVSGRGAVPSVSIMGFEVVEELGESLNHGAKGGRCHQ